jgi:hypothetical protein
MISSSFEGKPGFGTGEGHAYLSQSLIRNPMTGGFAWPFHESIFESM